MTQHTPGPWRVTNSGYITSASQGYVPIVTPFRESANRDKHGGPSEIAEANARLIAAAPDLLAALEDCLVWLAQDDTPQGRAYAERARAAIAKAEGR